VNDLRDELERVLGAQPQPDQGDVGALPCSDGADRSDVDLARDHLMAQAGDDLCEQLEPVPPLVRDQNTEMLGFVGGHSALSVGRVGAAFSDPCYYFSRRSLISRLVESL
jgi:hypothetical protein